MYHRGILTGKNFTLGLVNGISSINMPTALRTTTNVPTMVTRVPTLVDGVYAPKPLSATERGQTQRLDTIVAALEGHDQRRASLPGVLTG